MKTYKFLAVVAVFGCYVFGGVGASAQQICPTGGGACVSNPTPASSYSNARAVDVTRAPVAPVIVVDPTPAPGSYCGWAVVNQGSSFYSGGPEPYADGVPCQGHPVASLPHVVPLLIARPATELSKPEQVSVAISGFPA